MTLAAPEPAVEPAVDPSGPVLFARYAYPPNALGYCGPDDAGALLEAGSAGTDDGQLRHLARGFEGAWPYLQLIAGCNRIPDVLDQSVVRAYWIGNELLARVPASALTASLRDRFERRSGSAFESVVAPAGSGLAQHSFHVLAVYPWLGLLRAGRESPALDVIDRCRIRWGRVESVSGDLVTVRSRPLTFTGSRLGLGLPRLEVARRSVSGVGFAADLTPGCAVALHWDWVCDRLGPADLRWLRFCTSRNLAAVNALPAPGPAVACGA